MSWPFRKLPRPVEDILDISVSEARVQRVWHGTRARLDAPASRSRELRWVAAALLGGSVVLAATILVIHGVPRDERSDDFLRLSTGGPPVARVVEDGEPALAIRFEEESVIHLSPGSRWVPLRNEADVFESELERGHARFEVTAGLSRRWVVRVGTALVEVVGTVFSVWHSPERTVVEVEQGSVRVSGPEIEGGTRLLPAGERLVVQARRGGRAMGDRRTPFDEASPAGEPAETEHAGRPAESCAPVRCEPPPPTPAAQADPGAGDDDDRPRVRRTDARRGRAAPSEARGRASWQALAGAGQHREAYEVLGDPGISAEAARATPEQLMLLADIARLSGHPRAAVNPLERLIRDYPRDPRAPLAAVMLGRLEMDLLHRPERARRALERALELGVPAALREDVARRLMRLSREE